MSPRSQYVIGLYRDVNPTKSRCRPNIACLLGKDLRKTFLKERQKKKKLKEKNIWKEPHMFYNKRCKFTYMYPALNL